MEPGSDPRGSDGVLKRERSAIGACVTSARFRSSARDHGVGGRRSLLRRPAAAALVVHHLLQRSLVLLLSGSSDAAVLPGGGSRQLLRKVERPRRLPGSQDQTSVRGSGNPGNPRESQASYLDFPDARGSFVSLGRAVWTSG
ncbi:hypothetical protein NL676_004791 [Syzygium grande]|nr:hypothetical protein NL676_004791 [Syzygium grande]